MKVIISGGGTGGHIFPAIAIANALKAIDNSIDILFVGAKGKMEMEKVPAAGYKIEGLWISGIKREISIDNLSFPFKVISSLYNSHRIIKRFKPDVAVGVGGYASGPLLYTASFSDVPLLIQEQNSFPGITNKLLANKAKRVCVAYEGMEKFFPADKIVFTGNPVREEVLKIAGKRKEASEFFGLNENLKTILVVGGSQGARSINRSIKKGLDKTVNANIQLIWQTGKLFFEEAKEHAAQFNTDLIRVFDFVNRMDLAYAMADIVIARAGASTISELCLVSKPSVLVPLSTAAEDHQTHNSLALVKNNAAIMVSDADAPEKLVDTALVLIGDQVRMNEMSGNISKLGKPEASRLIAMEVLNIAGSNK